MNKKEIKKQMYYLDSELYSYQDIDNLKDYAKNLEKENQQLKKQKDDVVEYIKENENEYGSLLDNEKIILRMLGEIE